MSKQQLIDSFASAIQDDTRAGTTININGNDFPAIVETLPLEPADFESGIISKMEVLLLPAAIVLAINQTVTIDGVDDYVVINFDSDVQAISVTFIRYGN